MKLAKVKILKNLNVAGKYFKLSFNSPWPTKELEPGQFLEIRVNNGLEPFLRKPLSVHSVKGKTIEILYELIGEGTEALSKKKSGGTLDIIGPLGNGFSYQLSAVSRQPILVAGGIGIAPLMFLAQKLAKQKPLVLIGARTKKDLLCEKEFRNLGCKVEIATDDGSKGHKGFVTDLLENTLNIKHYTLHSTIYACGPKLMMRETARVAARHKIPCQVLLEEYMACGVGVCLGCAVKIRTKDEGRRTKDEYKMVCKDGPVFDAGEIIWE